MSQIDLTDIPNPLIITRDGAEIYPQPDPPSPVGDFIDALEAAWNAGETLAWTHGDVTLMAPIVLEVHASASGGGIDMQGSSIHVGFVDPNKDAITVQIIDHGVDFRYLRLKNLKLWGNEGCRDGIVISCRTNQSWIYNALLQDVVVEGCSRDGLVLDGSVFETQIRDGYFSNNGRHGANLWNDGPAGDVGIVSAIFWDGGGARKNGGNGLQMSAEADWTQPRNCRVSNAYFVENQGYGASFPMGADDFNSCGFENNAGAGIFLRNYGNLTNCIGSSGGPMLYLAECQILSKVTFTDCGYEGYGSLTGAMKLAKLQNLSGTAKAVLRGSVASDIDNFGDVTIIEAP